MLCTVGNALANSVESDHGCTPRVYFDNVTLTSHNVTLMSHKPFKYNNSFDYIEIKGCNIPHDPINEFYIVRFFQSNIAKSDTISITLSYKDKLQIEIRL